MKNLIYKINDKATKREIKSFFNEMDEKAKKELYFSVRNPDKEIKAIKNSDVITAREIKYRKCPKCNGTGLESLMNYVIECWCCKGTRKIQTNKLVGIARIVSDKTYYFYLTDIMVLPRYRKQGIATEMMKKAIKYCKRKGYIKIFLVPAKGLEKFYSRFGFCISSYPQMNILQKGIHNG